VSEGKHTPGPWWLDRPHKESAVFQIRANGPGGNKAAVARVYTYRGLEQAEADALLIAAAPELLEAAKDARKFFGAYPAICGGIFGTEVAKRLEAAIARAEGRSSEAREPSEAGASAQAGREG
jgi:hypothetical protein